jgi:hypothetical protein
MTRDWYRQHHELDAPAVDEHTFRPFYRRRTRIDVLVADHAIAPAVYRAAVTYRSLAERATAAAWGAREFDEGRERMPRMPSPASIDRVAARHRLDRVRALIGAFATGLCDAVIIEDLPWSELGRRHRVDPKTVKAWAIAALETMAAAFAKGFR